MMIFDNVKFYYSYYYIYIYIYHGGCTVVMYAQIGFRLETSRSKSKLILLSIFLCFPHVCLQKKWKPRETICTWMILPLQFLIARG